MSELKIISKRIEELEKKVQKKEDFRKLNIKFIITIFSIFTFVSIPVYIISLEIITSLVIIFFGIFFTFTYTVMIYVIPDNDETEIRNLKKLLENNS